MKILLSIAIILGLSLSTQAQPKEISQDWTAFSQSVDASFVKGPVKFRVIAKAKMVSKDTAAWSDIWVRIDKKNGEVGSSSGTKYSEVISDQWQSYTVEGEVDVDSDKIYFGGMCGRNGEFYFDNFEFHVQNERGEFEPATIENASFEKQVIGSTIPNWHGGLRIDKPFIVAGYELSSNNDSSEGSQALLVKGENIKEDTTRYIGTVDGFSPQVGALITMLNNLSSRVERTVQLLDQEKTDFLLDEKANSVGALIMHLAAAEAYYQVFTFEGRKEFNEEENKKWEVALELGTEAREKFKGKPIDYYLDIYKEVRQKTIAELKKRDDKWLEKMQPAYGINNHYCWFHVMEHQSSHLGQILMISKRFPEKDNMADQKIEADY